jgi:transposase
MRVRKVTFHPPKGKSILLGDYDHYLSLEWSQETMAIGHMRRRAKDPMVFERTPELRVLKEYVRALRGTTVLTFEETTTAHWLYLELRDEVDRILICNPYKNRLLCAGPKTDKIDAGKLCLLLRAGLLTEVFHSDDGLYDLRLLVSAYTDLVRTGVQALNQRSALFRGHSEEGPYAPFILEHLDKRIQLYRDAKEQYEAKFEDFCHHNNDLKRLLAVSGIGTIGAVTILATVVDARRFAKTGKYLSYCGLVKLEKMSGGRSYGRRKPQYSHSLKAVYKIAALAAIKGHNPIREYYDTLRTRGVAEHHARHQIARYVATVTYGILKTGTTYDPHQWRKYTKVA